MQAKYYFTNFENAMRFDSVSDTESETQSHLPLSTNEDRMLDALRDDIYMLGNTLLEGTCNVCFTIFGT